jgi:hypothetical protein
VFLHNTSCNAWKRGIVQVYGDVFPIGGDQGTIIYDGEQDGTKFSDYDTIIFKDIISPYNNSNGLVTTNTIYHTEVIYNNPFLDSFLFHPNSQALLIKCTSSISSRSLSSVSSSSRSSSSVSSSSSSSGSSDCFNNWPAFTSCITVGVIVGLTTGALRIAQAGTGNSNNICINKTTRTFTGGRGATGSNIRSFAVGELVNIASTPNGSYNGIYQIESLFSDGGILKCFIP